MASMVIDSRSPVETIECGRRLGSALAAGDVVGLIGDLGAGKTQFVKGLAVGLGIEDSDVVTSPTFVLMNSYEGRLPLRHYDLYRVDTPDLESLSYYDLLPTSAVVIEWAEKAGDGTGDRLDVRFEVTGPTSRRITFRPAGPRGEALFRRTFGEFSRS